MEVFVFREGIPWPWLRHIVTNGGCRSRGSLVPIKRKEGARKQLSTTLWEGRGVTFGNEESSGSIGIENGVRAAVVLLGPCGQFHIVLTNSGIH